MNESIQGRLRSAAGSLRTKPMPLSVFIPLLQEAADALDLGRRGIGPMTTPQHLARCPMARPGHSERLWNCHCGRLGQDTP